LGIATFGFSDLAVMVVLVLVASACIKSILVAREIEQLRWMPTIQPAIAEEPEPLFMLIC